MDFIVFYLCTAAQDTTPRRDTPVRDQSSDMACGGDNLAFNTSDNSITIGQIKLEIQAGGDITKEKTDAIVNSTNSRLDLSLGIQAHHCFS